MSPPRCGPLLERIAHAVAAGSGSSWAFALPVGAVLVWAATGPLFPSPLVTHWLEGGTAMPLHCPLLVAVFLVGVFANTAAIRRFMLLYAAVKSGDRVG